MFCRRKKDILQIIEAISRCDLRLNLQIHDQLSREVTDITFIHSESLNHIVEYESDVQRKLLISVSSVFDVIAPFLISVIIFLFIDLS